MTYEERQFHVNRIMFCRTLFQYKGRIFYVDVPSPLQKIRAELLYRDSLDSGAWTEKDRLSYLNRIWYWGSEDERKVEQLKVEIDDCKVDLYNTGFKKSEGDKVRDVIRLKYKELGELLQKRSLFDDTTNESIANQVRFKYIIACSIKREDNSPHFNKDPLGIRNLDIVNAAISSLLKDTIGETEMREISRNEPWASIWNSSDKCNSLFGKNAADLTDEQRILIYWSQLYDNIRSNADLSEDVINDDWKLDGWLIKRRREREKDKLKESVAKKITPKVAQGDMIFIQADNEEEMRAIDSLNDAGGKMMKAQLQHDIMRKGTIKYQDTSVGKEHKMNQWNEMRKK